MNISFPNGLADTLLWSDELGYGWHPRPPMDYNGSYWRDYVERDASPMGAALTNARIALVKRFMGADSYQVVDIGIGGGRFVDQLNCSGYDVNESAVKWLNRKYRFVDPYRYEVPAITCWDSLEHIPDPVALIRQAQKFVFVSMPVYNSQHECLLSKHYKPGEHIWYFSINGLIKYMEKLGFDCLLVDDIESRLGRDGIMSFVFRRYDERV